MNFVHTCKSCTYLGTYEQVQPENRALEPLGTYDMYWHKGNPDLLVKVAEDQFSIDRDAHKFFSCGIDMIENHPQSLFRSIVDAKDNSWAFAYEKYESRRKPNE